MSKSFAAAVADHEEEPIVFDLAGGAPFSIERPLSGYLIAKLTAKGAEGGGQAFAGFFEFLKAVLGDEEFERFEAEMIEKKFGVKELTDVASYIIEEGAGRPT